MPKLTWGVKTGDGVIARLANAKDAHLVAWARAVLRGDDAVVTGRDARKRRTFHYATYRANGQHTNAEVAL